MGAALRIVLAIAVVLGMLVDTRRAAACSCLPGSSIESAIDAAHAVVEARVAEVRSGGPPAREHRVVLDVKRTHKGPASSRMEVVTAAQTATCGYPFELGKDYLIYVHRDQGELAVSLCSRTRPLAEAGPDLSALATPGAPGATATAAQSAPASPGPAAPPVRVSARPVTSQPDDHASEPRRGGGCAGCTAARTEGRAPLGALLAFCTLTLAARRRRLRAGGGG